MTYNSVDSTQLFTTTNASLLRVLKTVAKYNSSAGITATTLANTDELSSSDSSFVSMLQNEFSTIDTNDDGKLSQSEYETLMKVISSKGLSYQELASLASTSLSSVNYNNSDSGKDSSLLQTVMSHFKEIDSNGDGRVSQTEINSYMANKQISDSETEFEKAKFKESHYSVMYSDDSSDDDSDTTTDSVQKIKDFYGTNHRKKQDRLKKLLLEAEIELINKKGFCPYELGFTIKNIEEALVVVEKIR